MSEDLTQKLPRSEGETAILTAVQNLDTHVRSSFDKVTSWVSSIDSRLQAMETKVQALETKVEERVHDMRPTWHKIDSRLKDLETKVEQRLHDTRPIWHKVVADIAQLQAGQQRLEKGVGDLNITVNELSRNQMVINDVIRKMQLDFHNIDKRLHTLELNRNQQNSST